MTVEESNEARARELDCAPDNVQRQVINRNLEERAVGTRGRKGLGATARFYGVEGVRLPAIKFHRKGAVDGEDWIDPQIAGLDLEIERKARIIGADSNLGRSTDRQATQRSKAELRSNVQSDQHVG